MATSLRSGDDPDAAAPEADHRSRRTGPAFRQVIDVTWLTSKHAVQARFFPPPQACLISWRSLLRITIVGLASNPVGAARG